MNYFSSRMKKFLLLTVLAGASEAQNRSWDEAREKARNFVSQLSTTEKVGLVSGGYVQPSLPCVGSIGPIDRLGFEGLCFSDGPAGFGRADGVSVFPSGITIAATWDTKLMYERGQAIGQEFRDKGSHVHLGPSAGPMGRHARGGRNWEGFGPDPYLAGAAMRETVAAVQSTGVQACSKHYVGNEQETQRTSSISDNGTVIEAVSSNIDDRTLHELYIWPFAAAVRAGTSCVMCAYNRVNGTYSCASPDILERILKDELAFPGYVVSDWYATHHSTESHANSGLDIEMPGNVSAAAGEWFFGEPLLQAVEQNQTVSYARLDDMAERVLRPYFRLGQDSGDFPSVDPATAPTFMVYQYGHNVGNLPYNYPMVPARNVRRDHSTLIRKIGAAGTVLLKNKNATLPLTEEHKEVGVFGNDAPRPSIGSVFLDYGDEHEGFEMGTFDIGGGSGTVRHTKPMVSPLDAIIDQVESYGGRVQDLVDNAEVVAGRFRTIYPVPDVCVVFIKAYASEGYDRPSLEPGWNGSEAVEATASLCPNTVVVLHGPGVVAMESWVDNENVTAILSAHYPGEEVGNAIVDVLWGVNEPSGRLPYTVPKATKDFEPPIVNLTGPTENPNAWQADFAEGQMIDYRYFDAADVEPLFEFGFGLSYAEFDLTGTLTVDLLGAPVLPRADANKGIGLGGLNDLWAPVARVAVDVRNVGTEGGPSGSTVAQLYVGFPQDTTPEGTPLRVLRGFEKVFLDPGQSITVEFELLRRDVSFWDDNAREWVVPKGDFTFSTGFSSRDLRLEVTRAVLD